MSLTYFDLLSDSPDASDDPLGWDEETLKWTRMQTMEDALVFHRLQEKIVVRCLDNVGYRAQEGGQDPAMLKYMGIAATVRDMVAMADEFDGPDAPIHFWGIQPGSLVGSFLQKSTFLLPLGVVTSCLTNCSAQCSQRYVLFIQLSVRSVVTPCNTACWTSSVGRSSKPCRV